MDKSKLHYYEQELRFLRELGAEFAHRFPKAAGRLGLGPHSNEDPHVERLFQGFALLAGRVQQRLDAEFPRFTETMLDQVYGHHLKPTPSMVLVQFEPSDNDSSLAEGFTIPRATELRARNPHAGGAVCQYRTAHAVQLWPIQIESLEYTSVLQSIADVRVPAREPIQALVRIVLRATGGLRFNQLQLSSLPLYVSGTDEASARLYEAFIAHAGALIMRWGPRPAEHVAFGDESPATHQFGFEADQALLPPVAASFRAYRLLHEYFAFPTRFHFVEVRGMRTGIRRCDSERLELILPMKRYDSALEGKLDRSRLRLFASPAANLFPRRCDVAAIGGERNEIKLLPDRTAPQDFEVHTVTRVAAHLSGNSQPCEYRPLQTLQGRLEQTQLTPHYAIERRPRIVSYEAYRDGNRSGYTGTDVFLHLSEAGTDAELFANKQLVVEALCTNRDVARSLALDRQSFFTLSSGAPVDEVRCLAGPSAPRSEAVDGDTAWRLLSHLSVNYLSGSDGTGGDEMLREMLTLYARFGDPLLRREVSGIRSIATKPVIGPYPQAGAHRFVRGLEVQLSCSEQAFSQGALALASVLSVFFARHVSTHSFAQTVFHTLERGEVHRLPALPGLRHSL